MEGNRDEAERCIEFAERFILEGKIDKAEKFLNKAERLFPTSRAKGKYFFRGYVPGYPIFSIEYISGFIIVIFKNLHCYVVSAWNTLNIESMPS